MAKAQRLTSNQIEILFKCVSGRIQGRLLESVPALVRRGLIEVKTGETLSPRFAPHGIRSRGMVTIQSTTYRLTPLGCETYEKLRTKRYEAARKKLDEEYARNMSVARRQAGFVSEETP